MYRNTIKAIIICLFFYCVQIFAQGRIVQSVNTNWGFHKGDIAAGAKADWEKVSLPHSWNTTDVYDDAAGYYRGIGWYKKTLYIPSAWKNKSVYLYFEGAN